MDQNPEKNSIKKESVIKEIVKFTLIVVIMVVVVRNYIAQPFIVSGASMDPTFASGEYLIVDELSYHFKKPTRGEVIIFRYPRNPDTFFIKRVIGLPGETVHLQNGSITIVNNENPDGIILPDSHIDPSRKSNDNLSVTLTKGEYFVMGDNRKESSDSRSWGPLPEKYVIGRPFLRLVPLTKVSLFPGK